MRKLRDVFYIYVFPESNEIVYYGMQFNEFLKYSPIELNQLLLLQAEYYNSDFSSITGFQVVDEISMSDFLHEDISSYGDFSWVDYNDIKNVEELKPAEIAELLYLAHMSTPLSSPFFEKIDNRYAYLSHDDGWFCRLYCKHLSDFQEIIAKKIVDMVSTSKKRKIVALSDEVKEKLFTLAVNGLLIDFSNILRNSKTIEIPIYTIGKFLDMDKMYNGLKLHKAHADYSARLIHKNKCWAIDYVNER